MILFSRAIYWSLYVPLLFSSCIIITLATAELENFEDILNSNSSLDVVNNDNFTEGLKSPTIVPPLLDVIHGKVNSAVHEIHGSIDDIPILMKTEITPEDSLTMATHLNFSETQRDGDLSIPVEQKLLEEAAKNLTSPEAPLLASGEEAQANLTQERPQDDIPSFSEWAKKQMAEAGRGKGENLTIGGSGAKLRFKNYASPDCGAKVVAANPEAVSPSAILSSTRDDYMLNPCNVKIWFIVELCEPIQPQRIEIANFELFSSSPQELSVFTSDRFPSRDWAQTGAIMARDERTVQSFKLPRVSHFVKYLKVELHSHYGSEHYCPISLFRAYGTSEIEVLETVDGEDGDLEDEAVGGKRDLLEELEVTPGGPTTEGEERGPSGGGEKTNLLGTAKAAVLSIVKKAAEVLVKSQSNHSSPCSPSDGHCFTPGYQIVCSNCSQNLYAQIFKKMCCNVTELQCLLSNPFVNGVITETQLCHEIGLAWNTTSSGSLIYSNSSTSFSPRVSFIKAFLPRDTIAALCNYHAVTRREVDLNVTHDVPPALEDSKTDNETISTELIEETEASSHPKLIQPTKVTIEEPTLITVEPSIEEVPLVVESKTSFSSLQLNTTEPLIQTPSGLSNGTEEKTAKEEVNSTKPMIDTKTKSPEADDPPIEPVTTVDSLSLDSLFPESEEVQPVQAVVRDRAEDLEQEETKAILSTVSPTVQKESVFVRLANRIRALEVNMSLSGQYLEELSRRYKRQVEELQRNLNSVIEEKRQGEERETLQAQQLAALVVKVEALSQTINELITDRDSWANKAFVIGQHGLIVVLEVVGFIGVVWVWRRLTPSQPPPQADPPPPQTSHISRRHSAEEPARRNPARRPSEEACLTAGKTHKELLKEGPERKVSREGGRKRKRRRKGGGEVVVIGASDADWQPLPPPPPDFIQTAISQRGKRSSQTQTSSSTERLSISSDHSSKQKKTSAIRRIVKKLF